MTTIETISGEKRTRANELLPYEVLVMLVDYNPETGALFWKARPRDRFKSSQAHTAWNTKYAGKPMFGKVCKKTGYYRGRIEDVGCYAHRVAWKIHYGSDPSQVIDHINGDKTDNRICNLRDVSQKINCTNKAFNAQARSNDYFGVYLSKGEQRYYAKIGQLFLGSYLTKQEAIAARKGAEIALGYKTRVIDTHATYNGERIELVFEGDE